MSKATLASDISVLILFKTFAFLKKFFAFHFLSTVAKLAEQEQHHPDLHLVRYRFVQIELYTHAVNGLSENDFILAAKIDATTSDD